MSKIKYILIGLLAIALLLPLRAHSDQILNTQVKAEDVIVQPEQEIPLSPLEYADKYAEQYGVDPTVFKKVMFCESSNNPKAVGDGGRARNVMQFHKPTFDSYSKKMGEELHYDSYQDQIKLAAWMFSRKEHYHWTCYKIVKG